MVDFIGVDPPITLKKSIQEVESCLDSEKNWVKEATQNIPVHTQAVERFVQLISSVSTKVAGEDSRNQRAYSTLASRTVLPKRNSKADYMNYMKK